MYLHFQFDKNDVDTCIVGCTNQEPQTCYIEF